MNWFNVAELFIASVLGFISTLFFEFISKKNSANHLFKNLVFEARAIVNNVNLGADKKIVYYSPTFDYISHSSNLYSGLGRRKYNTALKIIVFVNEFFSNELRFDTEEVDDNTLQNIKSKRISIIKAIKEELSKYGKNI